MTVVFYCQLEPSLSSVVIFMVLVKEASSVVAGENPRADRGNLTSTEWYVSIMAAERLTSTVHLRQGMYTEQKYKRNI